jgi:hypothetical protein
VAWTNLSDPSLGPGLAEYFVFDKQKYTLEEFFSDVKTFKVSLPSAAA